MTYSKLRRGTALVSLVVSFAQPAAAQDQPVRGPVTIAVWSDPAIATLMLVDELPAPGTANTGAVVIRRPGDPPNNIILVTPSTAPRDLAQAVTALAFSRRRQGDQVAREMRTAVAAAPKNRAPATRDDRRAEVDLRRIRSAPQFSIPGIARGRALVIRMADSAVTRGRSEVPTPPQPPRP